FRRLGHISAPSPSRCEPSAAASLRDDLRDAPAGARGFAQRAGAKPPSRRRYPRGMGNRGRGLRLGFIEPHLRCFGGIRRMLEFANRLHARGHSVTFYLPETEGLRCTWMPCDAVVKPIQAGFDDELDVVLFNHEPQWHLLQRFERARKRVFYALHYSRLYAKEGSWESLRAPVDLQLAN